MLLFTQACRVKRKSRGLEVCCFGRPVPGMMYEGMSVSGTRARVFAVGEASLDWFGFVLILPIRIACFGASAKGGSSRPAIM
jgi:hypothetical protein